MDTLRRIYIGECEYQIFDMGSMYKLRAIHNGGKVDPDRTFPGLRWVYAAIDKEVEKWRD